MSNEYKVGMYIRLSKEDEGKSKEEESQSINNQRELIKKYIIDNNYLLIDEYIDDGFSGTTFDRPNFKRMLKDIEIGKINTVITKDLSRLGRDYIQSGYYIEQYFPMKNIRYISILDNIDTKKDSTYNDIAPFKALFNDMQSKDTSKKIRSILKNKKQQGLFLGSSTSYGYLKDPNDKHKLIVDPYTSQIVKKIFNMSLEGKNYNEICEYLNKLNIKTPNEYKKNIESKNKWSKSTIRNILTNEIYTGKLIQGKQSKLNYKSKKRVLNKKENWIIVENTHSAIISKELFKEVNKKINITRKLKNNRENLLLEGLLYCKDCSSKMTVRIDKRNKEKIKYYINCSNYIKNSNKKLCFSHNLNYEILETKVLNNLYKKLNNIDLKYIKENIKQMKNNKKEIKELEIEKNKTTTKITKIYLDKLNSLITEDIYISLTKELNNNINLINEKIKKIKNNNQDNIDVSKILKDKQLIIMLIDKIYIDKYKNIEINYNFK